MASLPSLIAAAAKPAGRVWIRAFALSFLLMAAFRVPAYSEGLPDEFQAIRIATDMNADLIDVEDDIGNSVYSVTATNSESLAAASSSSDGSAEDAVDGEPSPSLTQTPNPDSDPASAPAQAATSETDSSEQALSAESGQPDPADEEPVLQAAVTTEPAATDNDPTPPDEERMVDVVTQVIESWASAWADQNVDGYLAHYAASFRPDNANLSRTDWEAQRQTRLTQPKSIALTLTDLEIVGLSEKLSTAVFTQAYVSDTYNDIVVKSLELEKEDGQWRISAEKTIKTIE